MVYFQNRLTFPHPFSIILARNECHQELQEDPVSGCSRHRQLAAPVERESPRHAGTRPAA